MIPLPQRSTLFPYTTLFRSLHVFLPVAGGKTATQQESPAGSKPTEKPLPAAGHRAREGSARSREPARYHHRNSLRILRSEEHTSELQSLRHLVCRLLLEKKK